MFPSLYSKLIAGGLLVVALLGFGLWFKSKLDSAEQLKQVQGKFESETRIMQGQYALLQHNFQEEKQRADQAEARYNILQGQLTALRGQLASLEAKQREAASQVASLSDSSLRGYIETKLGGSLDDPTVLRKDAQIITDYPIIQEQLAAEKAIASNQAQQIQALNEDRHALSQQVDSYQTFTLQLLQHYKVLYDAAQGKRRSPKCLWVWKCGAPKKLSIPSPAELKIP
jgi:hypothetical protein